MNHTRFPKQDHLPDWARRDNQVKKGDSAEKWRPKFGHEMVVNRITRHSTTTEDQPTISDTTPADYSYQITDGCAV